jgi:hypothetical protein
MKKNNNDFQEIAILKERQKLRILQQELKIKSGFRELTDNLTGTALKNRIRENLLNNSGLAFKLGFMAVSLLSDRIRRKRKK